MKNIFILPTTEKSRLHHYYSFTPQYALSKEPLNWRTASHIYITSDEEGKKDDWVYFKPTKEMVKVPKGGFRGSVCKKVILTTDPVLIADRVQAIDDEFLEWFVKNPTCECVEVKRDFADEGIKGITYYGKYFVIIPQKEPKQDLEKEMFELEQELDIPSSMRWHNSKPKQETLEEVLPKNSNGKYSRNEIEKAFESGAKWQAEKMYSEQIELINWLQQSLTSKKFYSTDAEDLIEQFKKK